jgi:hypothetical protein
MIQIHAVDRPEVPALPMPERFKTEVVYFMTPPDELGISHAPANHYWIDLAKARQWLDDYVIEVVSPLAADAKAEMELTEYQETWLEWLLEHQVDHIQIS